MEKVNKGKGKSQAVETGLKTHGEQVDTAGREALEKERGNPKYWWEIQSVMESVWNWILRLQFLTLPQHTKQLLPWSSLFQTPPSGRQAAAPPLELLLPLVAPPAKGVKKPSRFPLVVFSSSPGATQECFAQMKPGFIHSVWLPYYSSCSSYLIAGDYQKTYLEKRQKPDGGAQL